MKHFIGIEKRMSIDELKFRGDFEGCANLLQELLGDAQTPADNDESYELGAALLELAVYHKLVGNDSGFDKEAKKARQLLPDPDFFAMAARWLYIYGDELKTVQEFCRLFFDCVDEDFQNKDKTSTYYYDYMVGMRGEISDQ